MLCKYPAHIRVDEHGDLTRQSVKTHLINTAEYCSRSLSSIGFKNTGYFLGIVHDIGKMYPKFSEYIENAAAGKDVRRGSVDHSSSAVKLVLTMFHPETYGSKQDIATEIIAYALAAHHGAVDLCDRKARLAFIRKLEHDEDDIGYENVRTEFFSTVISEEEFKELYSSACLEFEPFFKRLFSDKKKREEDSFFLGLMARLLLSALVDADRRDTAEFMSGRRLKVRSEGDRRLWNRYFNKFEERIAQFKSDSPINEARKHISDACLSYAENKADICRLTVPTGAGKTLSSLRYALKKAEVSGKKRIFYIIPLLSVIEQNAAVLEDFLDKEIILEHHSNVFIEPSDYALLEKYSELSQSWNSPVVISTLVQLLNTLFDASGSSVRRMCSLCDSVIIIDEIQSLPRKTIDIFNSAVNFLTKFCRATVVLCSATQPSFEKSKHPLDIPKDSHMVKPDPKILSCFERTKIVDISNSSGYTYAQAAQKAMEIMPCQRSLLIICNTKAAVKDIYLELKNNHELTDISLYHLSTSMCPAHRKHTLGEINAALAGNERIICVSSQLVEAGVDFSFECVIRSRAGLDNIAQAAGRCNRNGEVGTVCPVYIMNLKHEDTKNLPDIRHSQNAFISFKEMYKRNPKSYGDDLLSDKSISEYYNKLFGDRQANQYFEYPCPDVHSSIYKMLSENESFKSSHSSPFYMNQAFKTAGRFFKVFEKSATDVIVPYSEEGRKLIADLYSERARYDIAYLSGKLKEASKFSVSIFEDKKKILSREGALHTQEDTPFITLREGFYNEEYGLDIKGETPTGVIL